MVCSWHIESRHYSNGADANRAFHAAQWPARRQAGNPLALIIRSSS